MQMFERFLFSTIFWSNSKSTPDIGHKGQALELAHFAIDKKNFSAKSPKVLGQTKKGRFR